MSKNLSSYKIVFVVVTVIAILAMLAMLNASINTAAGKNNSRKIVVFNKNLSEEAQNQALNKLGLNKAKKLGLINGAVVNISDKKLEKLLRNMPEVLRIEDDEEIVNIGTQYLPWGINKIDAELVWPGGNNGDPIKVAVLDTGISNTHPDLVANIKGGTNTITGGSWNDDHGHGSHIAGIIGALNNDIGYIGAAPLVDLYAVKVLGANGSGYWSDVIEGIQWSVANGMQVINMSLQAGSAPQSLRDAVIAARNAGIVQVACAGNTGGAVRYPAAYPEVIAVGATDSNNNLYAYSSRGPELDIVAPGVNVGSAYKGVNYITWTGTSQAAAHVSGAVALLLNTPVGSYDADSDGVWDPAEIQNKLQNTSTDLGVAGYDALFGWGLINAYNAVQ